VLIVNKESRIPQQDHTIQRSAKKQHSNIKTTVPDTIIASQPSTLRKPIQLDQYIKSRPITRKIIQHRR